MIIQDVIVSQNISRYQYFVPGPGGPRFRGNGGGIFISQSDPKLVNVTVSDNFADEFGGGVAIAGPGGVSFPIFIDCIISDNSSLNRAGGIYGVGRQNAHFIGGKIYNNSTDHDGGGIFIGTPGPVDSSQIHFTNVDIYSNHAADNGGGISIADPVVMNLAGCTIRNNSAGVSG